MKYLRQIFNKIREKELSPEWKITMFFVFLIIGLMYTNHLFCLHKEHYEESAFDNMLEHVLGRPVRVVGTGSLAFHKDIDYYFDRLKLSKKQWEEKSCILAVEDRQIVKPYKAKLKDCIFSPYVEEHYYNAKSEYCGFFDPQCVVSIDLNEYVLERPEIFKIILEYAKKPCAYYPGQETLATFKKINAQDAGLIKQNMEGMFCGNQKVQKARRVVINFNDMYGNYKFHLVINREDLND